MQKRLELGRALAMEPKLLLLDEPVAGMNLEETEDMARYILEAREALEIAIILVEHEMHLVMDLADRVMALDFGKPLATGPPAEVQADETVIEAYLGGAVTRRAATESLPALLLRPRPRAAGDQVALREKHRGRWREFTWSEYARRVARDRARAAALGVEPGDRVAIHAREPPRVAARRPRRSRASARSASASTRRARPPRSSTCSRTPAPSC